MSGLDSSSAPRPGVFKTNGSSRTRAPRLVLTPQTFLRYKHDVHLRNPGRPFPDGVPRQHGGSSEATAEGPLADLPEVASSPLAASTRENAVWVPERPQRAEAKWPDSSRSGPRGYNLASLTATSKRLSSPRKQGKRTSLKPPLRRREAEAEKCPEGPVPLRGSHYVDQDMLEHPNFNQLRARVKARPPDGRGRPSGCRGLDAADDVISVA